MERLSRIPLGTFWVLSYALAIIAYLWIMANVPVVAIPAAGHDDALFVRLAMNVVKGDWLGPYNNLTLAKGAFYPLWIAGTWIVGLPLLVTQGLAYALGCLLLARGLRPWLRSEAVTFLVFLVLLLNPTVYGYGQLRVMREGIYVPETLLIAAGVAWWFRWRDQGLLRRGAVAAAVGVLLAAFWTTREEGVWILPFLVASIVLAAVLDWIRGRSDAATFGLEMPWPGALRACVPHLARTAVLAGVTAGVAVLGVGLVTWKNQQHYGVSNTVEFKQHAFLSGYGALSRIRHQREHPPYVVIPREVLQRAYEVSPAAAELRPYFDSLAPDGFARVGCETYGVVPCDGEVRAGWFMWALRDAVAQAGHYRSASEAQAFYTRLAEEIGAACDGARLDCLPPRVTMAPPFRLSFVGDTVRTFGRILIFMATLDGVTVPRNPISCVADDCGQLPHYVNFLDMIHTTLFVVPPGMAADFQRRSGETITWPFQARSAWTARKLEAVTAGYRAVLPWLLAVAVLGYAGMGVMAILRRHVEPLFLIASLAALVALVRAALLAYLDVVAIPSLNSLYLSPAYPALLVFTMAAVLGGIRQAWAIRSGRADAVSPRAAAESPAGD
ncbi:MAG TPA: hypothetical protein VNR51_11560 [Hyphomicrobium sp.]|nr:hypothetical protein [Hyphomicrobium sp.]